MSYVIMYGAIKDGFTAVGPFDAHSDAMLYLSREPTPLPKLKLNWEIVELVEPASECDACGDSLAPHEHGLCATCARAGEVEETWGSSADSGRDE
ncbi:MAG TPA: hypothetical protein VGU68_02305 [Ktedonobacteraceae bacterium]|nr:hypothetical protein [Ktedonobacteraceae bacterium]